MGAGSSRLGAVWPCAAARVSRARWAIRGGVCRRGWGRHGWLMEWRRGRAPDAPRGTVVFLSVSCYLYLLMT